MWAVPHDTPVIGDEPIDLFLDIRELRVDVTGKPLGFKRIGRVEFMLDGAANSSASS